MKKGCLLVALLFFSISAFAQQTTTTFANTGYWDDSTRWDGGNIADLITEDVDFQNQKDATIRGGFSYTAGNVNLTNQNELLIELNGRLNVGSETENRNFTTNNGAVLTVHGDLYIYGDLVVHNILTLVVTGTMYVSGDVVLNNNSDLNISGDMTIDGAFKGGTNTKLVVDGTVDIGGDISVGEGSTLTGSGSVSSGGTCTGDADFCSSTILPVNLLYFTATPQQSNVKLDWASSKAWDFSHYELERSTDGITFDYLNTIDAEENTNWIVNYSYTDRQPLSGISYYRLKAVDIDGKFEYKGLEVVQLADRAAVNVYPNPSNRGFLHVQQQKAAGARVSLKDNSGRTVYTGTMEPSGKSIDTSALQPGMYVLTVESTAGIQKKHVIIQ